MFQGGLGNLLLARSQKESETRREDVSEDNTHVDIEGCVDEEDYEEDEYDSLEEEDEGEVYDIPVPSLPEEFELFTPVFMSMDDKGYALNLCGDRSLIFVCESPVTLSAKCGRTINQMQFYTILGQGCDLILNTDPHGQQYFLNPHCCMKQKRTGECPVTGEQQPLFTDLDRVLWVLRELHQNSRISMTKYLPVYEEDGCPVFHINNLHAAGTSFQHFNGFHAQDIFNLCTLCKLFLDYVFKIQECNLTRQEGVCRVAVHCQHTLNNSALILFIIALLLNADHIDVDNMDGPSEARVNHVIQYCHRILSYIKESGKGLKRQRVPSDFALVHFFPQWKIGNNLNNMLENTSSINVVLFRWIVAVSRRRYEEDLWSYS